MTDLGSPSPGTGGKRSTRYRILLVILLLFVAIVTAAASAMLGASLRRDLGPLASILQVLAAAAMAILAAVAVNAVSDLLKGWSRPEPTPAERLLVELLERLGRALRRPRRLVLVALVLGAIVAAIFLVPLTVSPAPPPPPSLPPGELVVMTAFGESPNDPRSLLIDQWEQGHPDNPVRIDYVPGEPDQQFERMIADAAPDGAHTADVYVLDIIWMSAFIDRGYIQPLDESELADDDLGDFVPKVLDTCRCGGTDTLWALPFFTDVGLIFYRSDLPGVGAPETWDDYFGASAKSTVADARLIDSRIEAANAAQLADEEMRTITVLEAIWSAGGELINPEGRPIMDGNQIFIDSPSRSGIEGLADATKDPDIVLLPDAMEMAEREAVEAFAAGRTLYLRNWPTARDQIGERVEFDVAAPPAPSALGGSNLAISRHTDNAEAAQALIEFLTSPSSQLILSEVGAFAPARQSAYSNSTDRSDIQELRTSLDEARLRLVDPNYVEFSQVFREGAGRALNAPEGELEERFAADLSATISQGRC